MRKAGITEEFVSLLWHTRLYLGHHLQPEEFSLLHQKPLDVFLLRVSSFASRRGAPSPSWGNALPAPAGLWLFLPRDAGGGTYWLQTCGKCLSHASTLHSVVIFASENDLCSHVHRGFPCPARGFSCNIVSAFFGGIRGAERHKTVPVHQGFTAPQNAHFGGGVFASSSIPTLALHMQLHHSWAKKGC